jgi:hypothetical protein
MGKRLNKIAAEVAAIGAAAVAMPRTSLDKTAHSRKVAADLSEKAKGTGGFGIKLAEAYQASNNATMLVMAEIAALPNATETAGVATLECEEFRDGEVKRIAQEIGSDSSDEFKSAASPVRAWCSRVSRILWGIRAGHWPMLRDAKGFAACYAMAAELYRGDRSPRKNKARNKVTDKFFGSMLEGAKVASPSQTVTLMATLAHHLRSNADRDLHELGSRIIGLLQQVPVGVIGGLPSAEPKPLSPAERKALTEANDATLAKLDAARKAAKTDKVVADKAARKAA